jgi:hypothetical protein
VTVLAKAAALLSAAHPDDLQRMTPIERRRLADLCWNWWLITDPDKPKPPRSGVLASLHDGARAP